jgi:hypothetical protein
MTKLDHKGKIATLCTAVLAAVLLALAVTAPADASFPGTTGKIAYYTGGDVWTMNGDGTSPTRLTTNYNAEANPTVSPDGSRIAYEFLRGIWIMNADGSGKQALTDGTATDEDPAFSADGTRIAFARSGDIWAMNVDGSGVTNLTNSPNNQEFDPSWSPLGDKIAYTRIGCDPSNFGAACVYAMNTDGTGQTNLTPETSMPQCPNQPGYFHNGASREPAWSPDGSLIAFSGALICPHTTGRDIWVMSATGGAKTNLTNDNGTNDKRPVFSPDGTKILFESDRESTNLELYTISASNGSGLQRLTNNSVLDDNPDWGVARPECATTDGETNSSLQGTASADTLTGTPGNDIICGLEGNDQIDGMGGNDIILGDAGNDRLIGASGRDTLNGGAGTDTASFAGSAQSIAASLGSGFAQRVGTSPVAGVALVGIENLTGSSLGDTLSGSGGVNTLTGGKGADEILGLGGGDTLNSRDGINRNDSLNGGPGANRCVTDDREASIRNCS